MKKSFALGRLLNSFILLSLLLPLLVISLVAMNFTRSFLVDVAKENNRQIVENLKTSVEGFFGEPSNDLKILRDLLLNEQGLNTTNDFFTIFHNNQTHFDHYMIIDPDGIAEFVFPENNNIKGFDFSKLDAYQTIKSGSKEYWSQTYIDSAKEEVSIDYALPLGEKVLIGTVHLKRLIDLSETLVSSKDLIVGITDSTGIYILHSDYKNVEQRITDPYVNKVILDYDKVMFDNLEVYGTTLKSDYQDWHVVAYEPASNLSSKILRYTGVLSLIVLISIVVVWLIANRIIRIINSSLASVLSRTESIAKGNYELIDIDSSFKEFDEISRNFTNMAKQIKSREEEILDKNYEIVAMNESLENRVSERTLELTNINHELIATIDDLETTKAQLVESEKLASLGSLVAGLAHEINTPLGIILTMITYQTNLTEEIDKKVKDNHIKESELRAYLESVLESEELIYSNVTRTCDLVNSFKELSRDQTVMELRKINLYEYMESILKSLNPKLKKTNLDVQLKMVEDIEMVTYPGSIYQVLVNIIINASIHAYNDTGGRVDIEIRKNKEKVMFIVQDYGKGISDEFISKIFDPFFTTARGSGGTGLGLNITYNTVKQLLEGSIKCESTIGVGTKFTIVVPRELKK